MFQVSLPVSVIMEKAVNVLKTQMPAIPASSQQNNYTLENLPFYRKQAWQIAKHYIVATVSLEDTKPVFDSYLKDIVSEKSEKSEVNKPVKISNMPCDDESSKKTFHQGIWT